MSRYEFTSTIGEILKQHNLTISGCTRLALCLECASNVHITEDTPACPELFYGTYMIVKATCNSCGKVHYLELTFSYDRINRTLSHLSTYAIYPVDIKELTLFTGVTLDEILNNPDKIYETYVMYEKNYMLYHSYKQNRDRKHLIENMQDRTLPLSDTAFAVTMSFPHFTSLEHFLVSLDIFEDKCYNRSTESEVTNETN